MINVFIADDHAIVRQGLKQIVSDADDMAVVGEAENGGDALHQLRQCMPDVLILDIRAIALQRRCHLAYCRLSPK